MPNHTAFSDRLVSETNDIGSHASGTEICFAFEALTNSVLVIEQSLAVAFKAGVEPAIGRIFLGQDSLMASTAPCQLWSNEVGWLITPSHKVFISRWAIQGSVAAVEAAIVAFRAVYSQSVKLRREIDGFGNSKAIETDTSYNGSSCLHIFLAWKADLYIRRDTISRSKLWP